MLEVSSAAAFRVLIKSVQAWQSGASQRLSGGSLSVLPLIKPVSHFQQDSLPSTFCTQPPSSPRCSAARRHSLPSVLQRSSSSPSFYSGELFAGAEDILNLPLLSTFSEEGAICLVVLPDRWFPWWEGTQRIPWEGSSHWRQCFNANAEC